MRGGAAPARPAGVGRRPRIDQVCSVDGSRRQRLGMWARADRDRSTAAAPTRRAAATGPPHGTPCSRCATEWRGGRRLRISTLLQDAARRHERGRTIGSPHVAAHSASLRPCARSSGSRPARRGSGTPSRPSCRPGTPRRRDWWRRSTVPAGRCSHRDFAAPSVHSGYCGENGRLAGSPPSSCPNRCRGRCRAALAGSGATAGAPVRAKVAPTRLVSHTDTQHTKRRRTTSVTRRRDAGRTGRRTEDGGRRQDAAGTGRTGVRSQGRSQDAEASETQVLLTSAGLEFRPAGRCGSGTELTHGAWPRTRRLRRAATALPRVALREVPHDRERCLASRASRSAQM